MLIIHVTMNCTISKEVDFDAESREERNLLYESKVNHSMVVNRISFALIGNNDGDATTARVCRAIDIFTNTC